MQFHFDVDPTLPGLLDRDHIPVMTDLGFLEREIANFKASPRRGEMLAGERYFRGRHDILARKRTAIGEDGELVALDNLPDNRVVDNQYRKLVVQKARYLLGQPVSFKSDDRAYADALGRIFDKRFMRLMQRVAEGALNEGIAWLMPRYDDAGRFCFRMLPGHEVLPGWRDAAHTALDYAARIYAMVEYEGRRTRVVERVEVYDASGVHYFRLDGGHLVPEPPFHESHFALTPDKGSGAHLPINWTRIPLVAFRRDSRETPLIRNVKTLQDGLNAILSGFQNNMEEDARNTILILVNYDGENLGQFRRNLAQYGAVKVRTVDGAAGDLRALKVEVNAENYKAILELFKKAIIENGMGFDAKDDRLLGEPNQMNIQSMYSDIDLDAHGMEAEFQAGFEELIWFANCHLYNTGAGDFDDAPVEVVFNRDMMINETEIIANIRQSSGLLSDETLIANHPWVDDPQAELRALRRQRAAELDAYGGAFGAHPDAGTHPGAGTNPDAGANSTSGKRGRTPDAS